MLGEGSFLSLLAFLGDHAPDPITRQVTRLARVDEARPGRSRIGLDRVDRFDAATRRIRAVLACGQLEYLAQRWLRVGWVVERDTCLQILTDSWCHLLTADT